MSPETTIVAEVSVSEALRLAAALRERLLPGRESGLGGSVWTELLEVFARVDANRTEVRRAAAEVVTVLAQPGACARDAGTLSECLRLLLGLGGHGPQVALRLLDEMPLPLAQMIVLMDSLSPRERLHLANALCLGVQSVDAGLAEHAHVLMASLDLPVVDVTDFLADLQNRGAELAWPIKERLRNGEYGRFLRERFAADPAHLENPVLLDAAAALGDMAAVTRLVVTSAPPARPSARLLRLAARQVVADDPWIAKTILAGLGASCPEVVGAAAHALVEIGFDKSGQLLGRLFSRSRDMRRVLAHRALVLPRGAFEEFLAQFDAAGGRKITVYLFFCLVRLDPDFCLACLKRKELGFASLLSDEDAQAVESFILSQRKRGRDDERRIEGAFVPGAEQASIPSRGFLARFFGRERADPGHVLGRQRGVDGIDFSSTSLKLGSFTDRTVRDCVFAGATLASARFERTTFGGVDFAGAKLTSCTFVSCSFTACSLRGAALRDCVFVDCEFKAADLSEARLDGVRFRGAMFVACHFGGAVLFGCTFSESQFRHCHLAQARLDRTRIRSSRLLACFLPDMNCRECSFAGVEFSECSLVSSAFAECSFTCVTARQTAFAGCRAVGCKADSAPFMRLMEETLWPLLEDLDAGRAAEAPTKALKEGRAARFMDAVLRRFARQRSLRVAELRMAGENDRRLAWAEAIMTPRQAKFLRLLPALLNGREYEAEHGLLGVPACRLEGFAPSFEQAEELTALTDSTLPKGRGGKINIAGLYAMGSLGTLAQSVKSDLDCWVCLDDGRVDALALDGLRGKLAHLEAWARDEFGLEVHFFLMTLDDIRVNRFGASDEESSGSAQALLLKDEFYRTFLRLGGGVPAWCLMPSGISAEEYERLLPEVLAHPLCEPRRVIDLGPLLEIPPEEFFGACLWQIVKAIKSPFKSIMKLGLLEQYARQNPSKGGLLCEEIKANIVRRVPDPWAVDPSLALYARVRSYYKDIGETQALYLLREAFAQRFSLVAPTPCSSLARSGVLAAMRQVFGDGVEPGVPSGNEQWSLARSSKMGTLIGAFMIGAYGRIRERLAQGEAMVASRITPQDMTRLGRRIICAFARRDHKVERAPFLMQAKRAFREMHLSADKAPGRKTRWRIKGRPFGAAAGEWETVRVSEDPVALFAFIVANGFWSESTPLHGDATIAPLAMEEVTGLLNTLTAFFAQDSFEVDPDAYLGEEQVVRAFFVLNLLASRDAKELREVWSICLTSWGELLCIHDTKPDPIIFKSAAHYLTRRHKLTPQPFAVLDSFIPRRSPCPRIVLA